MATSKPPSSANPKTPPSVALLVDTSTSWGRRILRGVHAYARKHGPWHLFVEARGMDEELRLPAGWRGDGVIARVGSAAVAAHLKARKLPVVNVSGIELPSAKFPRVTTDLAASAELAAAHFLDRGFQHFAYFSLLGLRYVATQQRAFVECVARAGFECQQYSVKPRARAEPGWNQNRRALAAWLASLPKPIGIFTWNAGASRELLHACQSAGLLVPDEIAVLSGSDDDLLCELMNVPVSAVFVAAEQIGHEAAALLDRLMRGRRAGAAPVLVPPLSVVTRQSTDTLAVPDAALVKALSFIRAHAQQPIQVSDVARHAGLSRRVLERRFGEMLDRTPAAEIRRMHFEHARRLLVESDLPIPEVAKASGFGSPEYLAQVFKAEMGKSPVRYRREIRSR